MRIKEKALELHNSGFAVTPVSGKAAFVQGWQQHRDDRRQIPNGSFENQKVTGIGCVLGHHMDGGYLAFIDVDVTHKPAAREIYKSICNILGVDLPFRVGQKPKFAVPVLVDERISKMRSNDYELDEFMGQHVEILCDGQQAVVYGTHIETQQPYQWINGEFDTEALPKVSTSQIYAIMEDAMHILDIHGFKPKGATPTSKVQTQENPFAGLEESDASDDEIIAMMKHIDPDADYDSWLKVGMALYNHYKGEEKGYALWVAWSSKGVKYQRNEMKAKWDSFRTERISKVGIPSIASLAKQGGADLSKLAKEFKHPETKLLEVLNPDTSNRFSYASDYIQDLTPPNWLIKGILESDSLAMTYGSSGAGKSFLALDMACSIAHGLPFHGHKTNEGLVVYMAGEGARGIKARLRAWHQHYTLIPNRNLVVSNRIVDMSDVNDIKAMLAELNDMGIVAPALIIIDTLARASGALDENSTKDMNVFVKNCDAIKLALKNASVNIIHHSGKASDGLARGSSVLRAAMDVEYQIEADEGVLFKSTKMKDGEPFEPIHFNYQPINLGVYDEDNEELTSAVLVKSDREPDTVKKAKHNEWSKLLLGILKDLGKRGLANPTDDLELTLNMGLDAPTEGFMYEDVRLEFAARCPADKVNTRNTRFKRALEILQSREDILYRNEVIYPF